MMLKKGSAWSRLPLLSFFNAEWRLWRQEVATPCEKLAPVAYAGVALPPYPLDIVTELDVPHGTLDEAGVPFNAPTDRYPAVYQATTIAQYGLIHWNLYLATGEEKHRQVFVTQANWLVEHEVQLAHDAGGWPIPFPLPDYAAPAFWLSALTQGNAISLLIRAYQLTRNAIFLEVARRATRTFELDIRDGGVSTCTGDNGVFFEEVAAYPAAHILNGYLFGLFGLYDYVAVTGDERIAKLIARSLATLHALLDAFDTGYWSRYDLQKRCLASHYYHKLHVLLLNALARYSGCEHCLAVAARWNGYQQNWRSCVRYLLMSRFMRYLRGLQRICKGILVRVTG